MLGADPIRFRDLKPQTSDVFQKYLPGSGEVVKERAVKIE
jgi:hypothetical protein